MCIFTSSFIYTTRNNHIGGNKDQQETIEIRRIKELDSSWLIRIVFKGCEIKDSQYLYQYGVEDESIIQFIINKVYYSSYQ